MKLQQIIRKADPFRIQSARYVRIAKTKMGRDGSGNAVFAALTYSAFIINAQGRIQRVTNPDKYVTTVTFIDNSLNVKVSCSCPDFMFVHEVALNHKDAADIEYSNGALPVIKNPRMIPSPCKHLIAVAQRILPKLPTGKQ